ncbi:hypothetical protein ROZALSC1DRAFT_29272 [Rozella allomycis CSF55]|uniref:Exosome complex component RRP4 n=1 Tax=Rozella allomycis (strain CSF55) TaxID=988480 RepID=A0A4P9YHR3_ROZAC|nr:hypothetical protein ROZALSC1DRAFT_29272 [Rozella allomycis CSF55]
MVAISLLKSTIAVNSSQSSSYIVTPGESITADAGFMRGHGTYNTENDLSSSVAGTVERINKLICVNPLKSRYNPEIGDVVVGRVTDVGQKRWKVDLNSRQDAALLLSAINLPGGTLRRRLESDELQIRKFFVEGDMLSAEVQNIYHDGSAAIHTRNFKYGKLRNGCLIIAPPALIKRSKNHFHTLACGVDIILGRNGYIWISKHKEAPNADETELIYENHNDEISDEERTIIARVYNIVKVLIKKFIQITDSSISFAYDASMKFDVSELQSDQAIELIARETSEHIRAIQE